MIIRENSAGYRAFKIIRLLLLLALALFLVWQAFGRMMPGLWPLLREGDEAKIAAYLQAQGHWKGILACVALTVMQVASIVVPAMPLQVVVGAIYGWWEGFLICFGGFWLANVGLFLFARRSRSRRRVAETHPMDKKSVWLMEKLKSAEPGFVVAVVNLIPGVPKGIVPYIAARSQITARGFSAATAAGSWFPTLCCCVIGGSILQGDWALCVTMIVVQIVVMAVVIWKRDVFLNMMAAYAARRGKKP